MSDSDTAADFPARRALDCMRHAVLVTDERGRVRYANPAAERLLGERAAELCGREMGELLQLVDEYSGQPIPNPVAEVLAGPPWSFTTPPETDPLLEIPARNERLSVRLSVGAMIDDGTTPTGVVLTIQDDSSDRVLRRALADAAAQDPLTRLVNRAEFTQRLQRLLEGGDGPHALLYLDLDHFRAINDQWGHAAGDHALREVTRMFSEMIRARDTFARLGGDEFGLLMEHCGPGITEQIASSLHATLVRRPLNWRDEPVSLAVSIGGVLVHKDESRDAETLLEAARSACERAKTDDSRPVQIDA